MLVRVGMIGDCNSRGSSRNVGSHGFWKVAGVEWYTPLGSSSSVGPIGERSVWDAQSDDNHQMVHAES